MTRRTERPPEFALLTRRPRPLAAGALSFTCRRRPAGRGGASWAHPGERVAGAGLAPPSRSMCGGRAFRGAVPGRFTSGAPARGRLRLRGRAGCGCLGVSSGAAGARTAPSTAGRRARSSIRRRAIEHESLRPAPRSRHVACVRSGREEQRQQQDEHDRQGDRTVDAERHECDQRDAIDQRDRRVSRQTTVELAHWLAVNDPRPALCDLGNAERHGVPRGVQDDGKAVEQPRSLGEPAHGHDQTSPAGRQRLRGEGPYERPARRPTRPSRRWSRKPRPRMRARRPQAAPILPLSPPPSCRSSRAAPAPSAPRPGVPAGAPPRSRRCRGRRGRGSPG